MGVSAVTLERLLDLVVHYFVADTPIARGGDVDGVVRLVLAWQYKVAHSV